MQGDIREALTMQVGMWEILVMAISKPPDFKYRNLQKGKHEASWLDSKAFLRSFDIAAAFP